MFSLSRRRVVRKLSEDREREPERSDIIRERKGLKMESGHSGLKLFEIDALSWENKAVYTAAPVAGGWAGAVKSWAGAIMG